MAPMGENFRGTEKFKMCPLCQAHLDNQALAFQCEILKNRIDIECESGEIYSSNVQLRTAETITRIEESREKLLKEKRTKECISKLL